VFRNMKIKHKMWIKHSLGPRHQTHCDTMPCDNHGNPGWSLLIRL
jgi:hypothetical protein